MAAIKPNENAKSAEIEAAKDDAFRERLGALVKDHSVRGLARKLGIPNQSVGNYLKKSQPPLSFGRKLVEKLGVNPAWVLTGEGSPMLSDVAETTSATAADLMELVKAMGDVMRMRLGALSGKKHAQALRDLNDSMVRYEELRGKLNAYSKPVMEKLIDDMALLLDEPGVHASDRLASLIKAGEQVGRFCEDPDLVYGYKRQRARYLQRLGDFEGAGTLAREVVAYRLLAGQESGGGNVADIQKLVSFLQNQYRLREASQIAEAGLIFTPEGEFDSPSYLQLLESAAMLDAARGNLIRARERILHILPRVDDTKRARSTMPFLAMIHFLSGAMTCREASALSDGPDTPFVLASLPFWTEKLVDLARYKRVLENHRSTVTIRPLLLAAVTSLLEAQDKAVGMETFDKRLSVPPERDTYAAFRTMNYPILRCQIALAAGQRTLASKAVIDADTMIERAKPRLELPVWLAALHHRNVLRVSAGSREKYLTAARTRAIDFFKRHIKAGYVVFCSALEETKA